MPPFFRKRNERGKHESTKYFKKKVRSFRTERKKTGSNDNT